MTARQRYRQERQNALLQMYREGVRRPAQLADRLRVGTRTIQRDMKALEPTLEHILATEKAQLLGNVPPERPQ